MSYSVYWHKQYLYLTWSDILQKLKNTVFAIYVDMGYCVKHLKVQRELTNK
jgi:hypothetical protein